MSLPPTDNDSPAPDSSGPLFEPEDAYRAADPSPAEASQLPHGAGEPAKHDPLAAMRIRDYRYYSLAGLIAALGSQIFNFTVGYELFQRTHNYWTLAMVGLVQAIPVVVLALVSGVVADKYDRRRIVLITSTTTTLCWLALALLSFKQGAVHLYFLVLFVEATSSAFDGPARNSLLPQLVPQELLANAVTWNSSRWQTAATIGPALAGFIYAFFKVAWPVYGIAAVGALLALTAIIPIRPTPFFKPQTNESAWQKLVGGITFVRSQEVFLATITLDLFAVFLGGAINLLPAFKDILHIGPDGVGLLRAAPAVGALGMSLWLSLRPPMKHAGKSLIWAVAGFGIATIVFGLSRNFWLSLLALAVTGALDNVSVVVRHTLLSVLTPAHMRGRVSAVNSVFIGASNELGGFESAAVAGIFGPVFSVVAGGIGTILVVLGITAIWPQVARLEGLDKMRPIEK